METHDDPAPFPTTQILQINTLTPLAVDWICTESGYTTTELVFFDFVGERVFSSQGIQFNLSNECGAGRKVFWNQLLKILREKKKSRPSTPVEQLSKTLENKDNLYRSKQQHGTV